MVALADKTCEPCHGGTKRLSAEEEKSLLAELSGWQLDDKEKKLRKSVKTDDFAQSLNLANRIGELADKLDHHPALLVRWGELGISIWTHAIDGLSEADFILAAKIDRLL